LGSLLAEVVNLDPDRYFKPDDDISQWIKRFEFARKTLTELDWPDVKNELFPRVISDLSMGCSSIDELLKKPMIEYLESNLDPKLRQILKKEFPEKLEVPTGNKIKVDYDLASPPSISVRLQEVFGWLQTPRLALGKIPVTIHLLSPGYKPVQVTSDLASFWKNAYHEVRRELKARYPKHSWPEDPYTAKPVAKGRPQR
jgi:ATP-dependent helicase HrpB